MCGYGSEMKYSIETPRLLLRPCRMDDLSPVHALWTNDRVKYFLFDNRAVSLDDARSFIEQSLTNFEHHGYGLWLVFMRGDENLVGFAGFLGTGEETPNLIYGIDSDFWGNGYATEAAGAAIGYALNKLGHSKVKADVDEPNTASVKVLEKLGLRQTGRAGSESHPLLLYELRK